jgi:DeoD family purine-nucleoside phosphorylase
MRDLAHIHQTAELAERVLLPGDPGRALRLAQELLDTPRMLNHNRGLWGYTGTAADGELLSIQSTGMGGPSAAIVATELIELGARRLLRIGTCGGLAAGLAPGDLLVVERALADDGTSRTLGARERLAPVLAPGGLTERLRAAAAAHGARTGSVVSADLFYDGEEHIGTWRAAGALGVEMETATIFTVAARHGAEAGAALLVSNLVPADDAPQKSEAGSPATDTYLDAEALHAAELALGRLAVAALL